MYGTRGGRRRDSGAAMIGSHLSCSHRSLGAFCVAAAVTFGCATHHAPAATPSIPIESFRAGRILQVDSEGNTQPSWKLAVSRQFVEDILGAPALAQCMEALQDPLYDGCSFTASACMTLQVREDGGFQADVSSWSCRNEVSASQILVIYNSKGEEATPPKTLPLLGLPSQEPPDNAP